MKKILILLAITLAKTPAKAKILYSQTAKKPHFILREQFQVPGIPWGLDFMDHKLIFTLRQGKIGIANLKTRKITYLKGVPKVRDNSQGGLLDIKLSPYFIKDDRVFITYSKTIKGKGATTLATAKITRNSLIEFKDILITDSRSDTDIHYGSRIAIKPPFEEFLLKNSTEIFITVGDRGERANAQNLSNHSGSVLRVTWDGKPIKDNPFINKKGAKPEIWSYGHRNPQGLVFDRYRNVLWLIEHGPRGGDEINIVLPGKNYGWPVISYGKEYFSFARVGESTHKKGMEQPVKEYTPSIAPCGLEVYSGRLFKMWEGDLFTGSLKLTHLNRISIKNKKAVNEERLLEKVKKRIRVVKEDYQGKLWLGSDDGSIMTIEKPAKK